MAANALMKRGKRTVALAVKEDYARYNITVFKTMLCFYIAISYRNSKSAQLTELLNYLLNPEENIDNPEKVDWLKALIAGGMTFEDFEESCKKKIDNSILNQL